MKILGSGPPCGAGVPGPDPGSASESEYAIPVMLGSIMVRDHTDQVYITVKSVSSCVAVVSRALRCVSRQF